MFPALGVLLSGAPLLVPPSPPPLLAKAVAPFSTARPSFWLPPLLPFEDFFFPKPLKPEIFLLKRRLHLLFLRPLNTPFFFRKVLLYVEAFPALHSLPFSSLFKSFILALSGNPPLLKTLSRTCGVKPPLVFFFFFPRFIGKRLSIRDSAPPSPTITGIACFFFSPQLS